MNTEDTLELDEEEILDDQICDVDVDMGDEDLDDILEDIPKTRKKREKNPTQEYVNKNEMWEEIKKYYEQLGDGYDWNAQIVLDKSDHRVDISHELSSMINDIAEKMGFRPNFKNYSYIGDMRGDAKLKMIKCIRDGVFKCWTRNAEIMEEIDTGKGIKMYFHCDKHWKKHKKLKDRIMEPDDIIDESSGKKIVTFKNNAFGYFSGIATNSFLNRIKKEKLLEDTKRTFQEMTWESLMATEQFKHVRRPKIIDQDENDLAFE